ncbi:MAG: dependent oxidoreductase [Myxococcaceae bacterium]|nr:dependent oxidoreductase [Myxococcaceae bacterium]
MAEMDRVELDRVDVAVIGGGVVGLAVARALALAGREVIVIEAERVVGSHTSARNSEVIHAGIYYPQGSLKAKLCVEGKQALYAYCAERGVAHERVGKLIVATREEELAALAKIREHAAQNGVTDLVPLSADEVHDLEPKVIAVAGLWSPSTGIIDSHSYMSALKRDAEEHGASVVLASPVLEGKVHDDGIELTIGGAHPTRILCRTVINAAGLWAPLVAQKIAGIPTATIPPAHFAKGHYFTMAGKSPFKHLVYPVPVPGGLGIHVTLDLGGQVRFGPDVSWLDGVDYSFDNARAASFYAAIRTYYPELQDGALVPGYTGIRPKLAPAGAPNADFVVQGPAEHGVPGLVNLYGIESPGLTASLAIAGVVSGMVG